MRRTLSPLAALALVLALAGCGESGSAEAEAGGSGPGGPSSDPSEVTDPELVYDREFLFVSASTDPPVFVPWFFRSSVGPDEIQREVRAWLARGGSWELLAEESSVGPFARAPWRILPGDLVRVVVGDEERIEAIRLRDPTREVETRVGGFIVEWIRPGADPARLFEGRTTFPSGPMDGFLVEVNRRWERPEEAPGDWIFLHAGSQLQLFLEESLPLRDPRSPAAFRGWSRLAFQNAQWSGIEIAWEAPRTFEPARRDIPGGWRIQSMDGAITGTLTAVSSHLAAREGDRPILPLSGFFEVQGEVSIRGEGFDVVGLVRHLQR